MKNETRLFENLELVALRSGVLVLFYLKLDVCFEDFYPIWGYLCTRVSANIRSMFLIVFANVVWWFNVSYPVGT